MQKHTLSFFSWRYFSPHTPLLVLPWEELLLLQGIYPSEVGGQLINPIQLIAAFYPPAMGHLAQVAPGCYFMEFPIFNVFNISRILHCVEQLCHVFFLSLYRKSLYNVYTVCIINAFQICNMDPKMILYFRYDT